MTRSADQQALLNVAGRVGIDQETVEPTRVGSGRFRKSHGSGQVALARSDPRAMIRPVKGSAHFDRDKIRDPLISR